MTFDYTHDYPVYNSSVVEDFSYNANDQTLLVVLTSRDAYVYSNVPHEVVDDFYTADSKGYFYNKVIKAKYGPGNYVGYDPEVYEVVDRTEAPEPVLTPVAGPTLIDLAPAAPFQTVADVAKYSHVVHFVLGDGNAIKTHTVEAGSDVLESVEAVLEAAKMLGVDLTVKGVYVDFS